MAYAALVALSSMSVKKKNAHVRCEKFILLLVFLCDKKVNIHDQILLYGFYLRVFGFSRRGTRKTDLHEILFYSIMFREV